MWSSVYGAQKICKFDKDQPGGYRDTGAENGKLAVPVNNTLVCHMAFLPSDTRLCFLM